MAGRSDVVVRAPGLSKLRRDLRKIDDDLGNEAEEHLRGIGREVSQEARSQLHSKSKNPQGRIEDTIDERVTPGGVSVVADHPGAGVQEWGGVIEPRGTPIEIKGKAYMRSAVDEKADDVDEQLGDLLDVIARRNGF